MNTFDKAELAQAIIDAQSIANLLDRFTPEESGLSNYELRLMRAHTWALVDGLQSLVVRVPLTRPVDPSPGSALASSALLDGPARPGVP